MSRTLKKALLVIGVLLLGIEVNLYTKEHFILEQKPLKVNYSGYGHKLAKKLEKAGLHPYEITIIMVEQGGVIQPGFNLGNLRKKNLEYNTYGSFEEGLTKFKKVINRKYKDCFSDDPQETYKCIQEHYAPDGGDTWIDRNMHWYNLLYGA